MRPEALAKKILKEQTQGQEENFSWEKMYEMSQSAQLRYDIATISISTNVLAQFHYTQTSTSNSGDAIIFKGKDGMKLTVRKSDYVKSTKRINSFFITLKNSVIVRLSMYW